MLNYFKKENLERIELIIRILAILLAGIWALYTFVYQNKIAPTLLPTVANVKSDFIKIGKDDSFYYYKLYVTLKNESSKIEKFPATYFNILGYTFDNRNNYNPLIKNDTLSVYSKYSMYKKNSSEYFFGGSLFSPNLTLAPSQENTTQYLVKFPTNKYEVVDVRISTIQCNQFSNVKSVWRIDSLTKKIFAALKNTKNNNEIDIVKEKDFIESNSIYFQTEKFQYCVSDKMK